MKTLGISDIDEMLLKLSKGRIQEVKDYVEYLLEKERKHKAFVKRVLNAKKERGKEFKSVNALMKAIREFEE